MDNGDCPNSKFVLSLSWVCQNWNEDLLLHRIWKYDNEKLGKSLIDDLSRCLFLLFVQRIIWSVWICEDPLCSSFVIAAAGTHVTRSKMNVCKHYKQYIVSKSFDCHVNALVILEVIVSWNLVETKMHQGNILYITIRKESSIYPVMQTGGEDKGKNCRR